MPKKQLEVIGEQVPCWMRGSPACFNAQMSNMGEASSRAVANDGARLYPIANQYVPYTWCPLWLVMKKQAL